MKQKSLYGRLARKGAITAVVDAFVARVAADKRINGFVAKTASDPERLKMFKMRLEKDQLLGALGPMKVDIVEK